MKKGIIYVIGLFPLLIGVSAFAEDFDNEVMEEIIEEIEVPEYEVSDAINKSEEIIKSIDKSVLFLKTMDLENETENEGTNTGNNYYIVDNDYSQINERLDQIDNKLNSLSFLGDSDNEYEEYSYIAIISSSVVSVNGSLIVNSGYDTYVYLTYPNSYFTATTISGDNRFAFSDTYDIGSSIYDFAYVRQSSTNFSDEHKYLLVSINKSSSLVVNVYKSSASGPDNPDNPDNPDDPIEPDSNILDTLNSIKAELVKINKYNDTKLYSSEEEFKEAPLYMNKYQYETYKLLRYLVILSTCVNGLMLIYIFGGRKRGST